MCIFALEKSCSLENQKNEPVSDSDGVTGAHRLVGARPMEYGCGSYFGSAERSNRSWGSRGLAPSCCLPHWGREGVTLAISTPAQKTRGDFYRACIFLKDLINITIPGVDTFCMKKTKSPETKLPGVKTKPALAPGTGYLLRHCMTFSCARCS